jgi:hypothetical protein
VSGGEPILPADRRLRLYLGIARRLRPLPEARGVRRAAIEKAWEARRELRASGTPHEGV